MSVVEDGSVFQVGTYNGNPLGMAAARANLTEVLTPEAYQRLDALNERILRGCTEVIERYGLSGYSVGVGSKGCVTFSPAKIVDYETFKENQDAELADLAWLFNMNRGIFMTPGREEEWTLSVTHTDESVDRYVAVFDEMARDLTALTRQSCSQPPPPWRRSPLPFPNPCHEPGARAALPGPRHGAAQPPARRAQSQQAARRAADGEPDRQPRRRTGGALRRARLAERDARPPGRSPTPRAGATGSSPGRSSTSSRCPRAAGPTGSSRTRRASSCGPSTCAGRRTTAGAHRAQARLLPARPRPRARRADRPAPALLRRLQPARGHAPDHAGDVGGLGRRLPVDLSRQLDRRHGLERLLRGRAPRRPGQRHLRVQRGQQRLVDDRAPALQARAAALPAQGAARAARTARARRPLPRLRPPPP